MAASTGAKVVFLSLPYADPPTEAADGSAYPENEPSRVDGFNAILRRVASQHAGVVSIIDLNQLLDPGGQYTSAVDGIIVRVNDGIHITEAGGQWLQPRILPTIAQLGLASDTERGHASP